MYRTGRLDQVATDDALALVGAAKLELFTAPNSYHAKLSQIGMALDPGADGKGAAVDAMVSALREAGVTRAFLDFGGSTFYGLGNPPGKNGWPVAVQGVEGRLLGTLTLKDQALSVSTSLRQELISDEDTSDSPLKAHIVDPRDGSLVGTPRTAVALSPSGVEADVLSTVLIVTGAVGFRFCGQFESACAAVFEPGRTPVTQGNFDRCFQPTAINSP
jgi:thiamine biosynthesis lipoprotein